MPRGGGGAASQTRNFPNIIRRVAPWRAAHGPLRVLLACGNLAFVRDITAENAFVRVYPAGWSTETRNGNRFSGRTARCSLQGGATGRKLRPRRPQCMWGAPNRQALGTLRSETNRTELGDAWSARTHAVCLTVRGCAPGGIELRLRRLEYGRHSYGARYYSHVLSLTALCSRMQRVYKCVQQNAQSTRLASCW